MEEFTVYYGYKPNGRPKIGVDCAYPNRIMTQKLTNHRVLEVHTCVYEASDREQELQRQHGVRVDHVPYHVTYFTNKNTKTRPLSEDHKIKLSESNRGLLRTEDQKRKISMAKTTTTRETDLLVIQDRLLGMTHIQIAVKHNITRGIVRRIIKHMNE